MNIDAGRYLHQSTPINRRKPYKVETLQESSYDGSQLGDDPQFGTIITVIEVGWIDVS